MSRHVIPKRRAARFAAVQALYQLEIGGQPVDEVVREFREHRLGQLLEAFAPDHRSPPVDFEWFERVVRGAQRLAPQLDPEIASCLAPGWTLARCGYVLRACLRAGAFELAACPEVPPKVVITEYVEVTALFFAGDEPGFVNAVLDRLARKLRAPSAMT